MLRSVQKVRAFTPLALQQPQVWHAHQTVRKNQQLLHVPITDSLHIANRMGERAFRQKAAMGPYSPNIHKDIDFCTCDVLALSMNEEINKVHADAIRKYGVVDSTTEPMYPMEEKSLCREFEKAAAEWLGVEETVLVNSGADANIRLLDVLSSGNDIPVYCEERAHATFVMGVSMAGRKKFTVRQDDLAHLRELMTEHGPGIVCIDSINSVLGTIAPVKEYVEACEEFKSVLIVDESHAAGHFGVEGKGIVHVLGLSDRVPFRTLGLGKTFAGNGGLVACTKEVAEIFHSNSGMSMRSRRFQEHDAARMLKTLDVIRRDKWRLEQLDDIIHYFRKGMWDIGYRGIFMKENSAICPMIVGPELETAMAYYSLAERGIFPIPFTFPATARGRGELRFQLSAYNTNEQMDRTFKVMKEMYNTFRPWTWPDTSEEKYWSKTYLRM